MRHDPGFTFQATMLLALFAVLSSLSAHASSPPPAVRLALWSEFVPYQQVESYLPQLAAEGISLNVAFHFDQPDFDGFAQLYKQAAKNRVEVRPWLLLRKDDGYWFNSHNIKLGRDSVQEFITEMGGRGVKPNWIIFDVEPPKNWIDRFVSAVLNGRIDLPTLLRRAGNYFKESKKANSTETAVEPFNKLIAELHKQNIAAEGVTSHWLLHDANTTQMQDSMGTPFKGVKFDQVSFMLYRVELEKLANQLKAATNHSIEVNAFAIKTYAIRSLRYAENAKNFWGKNPRTSVDLGEVGRVSFPENFTGMLDPNELVKDINAARVAGVKNINIYSLDGMLNEKGLAAWLAPIHNCIAATPDIKFSLPHRVSAKDVTKTIQHEEWNAEFHAGAIDQSLSLTYLGQVF